LAQAPSAASWLPGWRVASEVSRLKKTCDFIVIDSPPHIETEARAAIRSADLIIVPVQPSVFDMAATSSFLQTLLEEKAVRKHKTFIGIVGVRVNPRTRAAATLEAFLSQFNLPVLTYLRDTQIYVNAAFNGLSLFDLPVYLRGKDVEQWQPMLHWIEAD